MGEINYDPLEWGWKLNENSLAPIMTNLDPSPSYLPQCVSCKCKAENRRCSTSICSCRKHGLNVFHLVVHVDENHVRIM